MKRYSLLLIAVFIFAGCNEKVLVIDNLGNSSNISFTPSSPSPRSFCIKSHPLKRIRFINAMEVKDWKKTKNKKE